tara:strand:+ start:1174 stop:1353 length:180 start_codon:yes stop_codon:yes gene_type:complete
MSSVTIFIEDRYCIISSFEEDAYHFVKKVSEQLKEGWALNGGLASSNSKIFQAMIKEPK